MSCITLTLTPVQPATVTVAAVRPASVAVDAVRPASVAVAPRPASALAVAPRPASDLAATPVAPARLTIGEVCSVGGGELYVLAATDGPLRTRDGGYILLDPARETD